MPSPTAKCWRGHLAFIPKSIITCYIGGQGMGRLSLPWGRVAGFLLPPRPLTWVFSPQREFQSVMADGCSKEPETHFSILWHYGKIFLRALNGRYLGTLPVGLVVARAMQPGEEKGWGREDEPLPGTRRVSGWGRWGRKEASPQESQGNPLTLCDVSPAPAGG